ncbi:MAG: FmdB family zinc ribbon protein [Thermotogota bacterium]|nr:FmdB family zinc ribbon protein [Thermotogota bacterium]
MPIYRYKCNECGWKNDLLLKINQDPGVCPECGGKLEKLITIFSVASKEGPSSPCSGCNSSDCSGCEG